MEDIQEVKASLRKELLAKRAELSEQERAMQSLKLGAQLAAYLDAENLPANLVAGVYKSFSSELDPSPAASVLYASGATVCYPCTYASYEMDFFPMSAADLDNDPPSFITHPGKCTSAEEVADMQPVNPREIDILLVPGVAFDKKRNRMGYGGGCYDRYIPKMRPGAKKIGICFDCQLTNELPVNETDQPLDVIITPTIAF